MGVERALAEWRRLLRGPSMLAVSDLVWLSDSPSAEAVEFWSNEYPDMQPLSVRRSQIEAAGYDIVHDFTLSLASWSSYIEPLCARVAELALEMEGSAARQDLETEIGLYDRYPGTDFGFQFFIL